jgi:hypothetical protein
MIFWILGGWLLSGIILAGLWGFYRRQVELEAAKSAEWERMEALREITRS